jgi:hypothetical protein
VLLKHPFAQINFGQDKDFDYNKLISEEGVADFNIHSAPLFAFDTDAHTLYLKHISQDIKRADLMKALRDKLPGFLHLSMSEPMRNNNYARLAWITLAPHSDIDEAIKTIASIQVDEF